MPYVRHYFSDHLRYITFIDPEGDQARQEMKAECDINNIMAKYQRTGVLDHIKSHGLHYGDYEATDFQQAMELLANAQAMFDELPSKARKHFKNDPAEFLSFINDPNNADLMVELGLAKAVRRADRPSEAIATETGTGEA